MKLFNFTIVASGLDPTDDSFEDRLFEAGCGDATISFQKGAIILEFTREAKSFAHALMSAILNVHSSGAKVDHIEPDYLVNLSDMAKRLGISRSAVSLFAKGQRGREFPAPIARITTESPLWDWVSVARWMFKRRSLSRSVVAEAKLVKEANLALQAEEEFEKSIFAKKIRDQIAERDALACA